MRIVKVIEVIATSDKSFEDATRNAVVQAAKTIKHIKSIYVKDFQAKVENDQIVSFGVNAKISFEVEG
jgi:flavin-binding protein dodecin